MLLCFTIITRPKTNDTTVNGIFLYIRYTKSGKHAAHTIDASETYLKIINNIMKMINSISMAFGAKTKKTPKVVATPFPPLNFRKTEKVWPRIAIIPTTIGSIPIILVIFCNVVILSAKKVGITPFKTSKKRTKNPNFAPKTLAAFVAPAFLLPCSLTSIRLNNYPTQSAYGTLPKKYANIHIIIRFIISPTSYFYCVSIKIKQNFSFYLDFL